MAEPACSCCGCWMDSPGLCAGCWTHQRDGLPCDQHLAHPAAEIGCMNVMFRGAVTGRVVACGVCDWCVTHFGPDAVRGPVGSPSGSGSAGEASKSGSMPARRRGHFLPCSRHEPYVLPDGKVMATCRCRPAEAAHFDREEPADG